MPLRVVELRYEYPPLTIGVTCVLSTRSNVHLLAPFPCLSMWPCAMLDRVTALSLMIDLIALASPALALFVICCALLSLALVARVGV